MDPHSRKVVKSKITLGYTESGLLMAALDHALCYSPPPSESERRLLRPLVDRMVSTFGFPTGRIDRLLKGQRVKKFDTAFEPEGY